MAPAAPAGPDFRMNTATGKAILALARGGDFAHPGEAEAIELAVALVDKAPVRRLLDVGCGRGGTAVWLADHGWGEVVGVDIDAETVAACQEQRPNVSLHVCDVCRLADLGLEPFDLVYLFTAFYAFPDQPGALRAMRQACRPGGTLLLVDYCVPHRLTSEEVAALPIGIPHPVVRATLREDLRAAGWQLEAEEDWSARFVGWYAALLARFREHQADIEKLAGPGWFDYVLRVYGGLYDALQRGTLGGVALTARAVD